MSHVTAIDAKESYDIPPLVQMCKDMGWEWRQGQKTHRWFGRYMGDHPLPAGFTAAELGHCSHAIHVPGARYEIGVVQKSGEWKLVWDFWEGGYGLRERIGAQGGLLKQAYGMAKAKITARQHRRRFYKRPTQQKGWTKLVVEG